MKKKELVDSRFAQFNPFKLVLSIPMLLAAALVTYISYQFMFNFMPKEIPAEQRPLLSYSVRIVFSYFSIMTYVHLTLSFVMSPGYAPDWLKCQPGRDGKPPYRLLRIYNMRFWARNNIYSFDEFDYSADQEANADADQSTE